MPKETEVKRQSQGEIWKPAKKGDFVMGQLVKVRDVEAGEYGKQKAIDLRTNKGPVTIFADKVLGDYVTPNEVDGKMDLTIGHTYKFTFLGWGKDKVAEKSPKNRYRAWKVTELEK